MTRENIEHLIDCAVERDVPATTGPDVPTEPGYFCGDFAECPDTFLRFELRNSLHQPLPAMSHWFKGVVADAFVLCRFLAQFNDLIAELVGHSRYSSSMRSRAATLPPEPYVLQRPLSREKRTLLFKVLSCYSSDWGAGECRLRVPTHFGRPVEPVR